MGPSDTVADVSGSQVITPHDYVGLGQTALANNPPACGMPYSSLDINRITAVENLNAATDCGACVEITNTNDPSKKAHVLAVDRGGRGLDVSTTTFNQLFGTMLDPSPASWKTVDKSNCADIIKGSLAPQVGGQAVPQLVARENDPKPTETKKHEESGIRSIPSRFASMTGLEGDNKTSSTQHVSAQSTSDGGSSSSSLTSTGIVASSGLLTLSILFANL
ncbi:MAG: hypothetical protein DHS80DRAFT_32114 [Piptocephalis tieghemiana]|nr:MAG: hypothetical protein DHS80DRAFT_32114 [Piptocephalis tieghemiana]